MVKKFNITGLPRDDAFRHFKLVRSKGAGTWDQYDRVVQLYSSRGAHINWQIETRVFNCCGFSMFENLNFEVDSQLDADEQIQEFVHILCAEMPYYPNPSSWSQDFGNWPDALYVDTDYGLRFHKDSKVGTGILKRFGATEVYATPNKVHGPEKLHMLSWNPRGRQKELEEFLYFPTYEEKQQAGLARYAMLFMPKYMEKEWKDEHGVRIGAEDGKTVSAKAPEAIERGSDGAVGGRGVEPVHGHGVQQPGANQNHSFGSGDFAAWAGPNAGI